MKTHEEIQQLFRELKELEDRIKNPVISDIVPEQPIIQHQEVPLEVFKEVPEEPTKEVPPPSTKVKKKSREKKKEKTQKKNRLHLKKTEKTPEHKKKRLFQRKKKAMGEGVEVTPELQKQFEELVDESIKEQSTFTLRFDDKGNLVGYNLKKPKPVKQPKQKTEPSAPAPEAKGIKGKLKRVTSKLRPKRSGKEGGSRFSGIGGKLKGIIPKRSKK